MDGGVGTEARWRESGAAGSDEGSPPLSARETQVLQGLAERRSTACISATLAISDNTVRTHVRTLMRKLAVDERSEVVPRARELQLI